MKAVPERYISCLALVAAVGIFIAASLSQLSGCGSDDPSTSPKTNSFIGQGNGQDPLVAKDPNFVGKAACIKCHQDQHDDWLNSHHDKAMQVANEKTVLGDFNNVEFTAFGVTSKLFKKDGKFFVNTDGPDGKLKDYEIKYVFGIEPLQQYLIPFKGGRLQTLPISWDTKKKRWFHVQEHEKGIDHNDPLHWTKPLANWNYMCAECHSTNLQKNYDLATDTYRTTYSEINVSCEACHGPGRKHVAWAESYDKSKPLIDQTKGLDVRFKGQSHITQVEACARCHSRRHVIHSAYDHSKGMLNTHVPQTIVEPLYYADGQIRDEVYVYGSYAQSKMYHMGVKCTDCHNPHSLKLKLPGNALCTSCHMQKHTADKYDTPAHHHHKPGSPGASCINCHMPHRTYMVVDPRRDHSFRVPRPDLTVKYGVPNACNQCHADKKPKWAADAVVKWYGKERKDEPHFIHILKPAQDGKAEVLSLLAALATNETKPAIVRATALSLLRRYVGSEDALQIVIQTAVVLLRDKNPLIRHTAIAGVDIPGNPPQQKFAFLYPMLKDPVRAVRMEAARIISSVPPQFINHAQRAEIQKAIDEYTEGQLASIDRPGARLNLAVLNENIGRPREAISWYRSAIKLDGTFVPAKLNLAVLLSQMSELEEAEVLLREVIKLHPDFGEAYYSLGLLKAEQKQAEESLKNLTMASKLMPEHHRAHYNYSLALEHAGRLNDAKAAMINAQAASPNDPKYMLELVRIYGMQKSWQQANYWAKKSIESSRQTKPAMIKVVNYFVGFGQLKLAANWMEQLVKLKTADTNDVFQLIVIYSTSKQWEKANNWAKKAVQRRPDDIRLLSSLVQVFARHENWPLAVYWGEQIVKLRPNDPKAKEFLQTLKKRAAAAQK